ncbi:MAG TPA: family 20 glycosylhydrolase [Gemmatimonadales bacterium]|nr:family 20 glycosylhydrolase [Gemmatimonadales bacterium]
MRNRLLPALPALLLTLTASAVAAQTTLGLRWELVGDSIAAFTLTNHGPKALPPSGWAIYYNALHGARPGSVGPGFTIEDLPGDLHRLVPATGFAGLARGATVRIPYVTDLLLNASFVPKGPYIVFDDAKDVGVPLSDYVAAPFEHASVASPEKQFALDSAIRDLPASDLPPVFPTPVELTNGSGALRLAAMPPVEAPEALRTEAAFAAEYLRPYFSGTGKGVGPRLRLEVGPVEGQTSPEAYSLVVDSVQGVRIVGASPAGVFYGLQSLRSLLPAPTPRTGLVLSTIQVVDAPRFGYRGFMLDVARNFHPKPLVLRTLDLLARYKLNVFHIHLTDDEGWRVEISTLPELTAVGARRGHPPDSDRHLQPAFGSGPAVDRPWGSGFFSHADYVEIVRYAAARHIEVIPEIEMPGHARAAIKAVQHSQQYRLNDPADRSVYTSVQGYPDNVMNPALESTYGFIERVVGDLAAMHREAGAPLRHIHMGGDEVPAGVWVGSPAVQAYMQAHAVSSVDDLWFVFYGRVEQILKAQGIAPSGWEEIAVRKTRRDGRPATIVNPGFAERGWRAYVWNNVPGWGAEDLAYRLANGGYDVVLSPVTNLYLDLAWNQSPDEIGLDWGGYVDLRKPFDFIPFDYYRNARLDRRGNPLDPAVFAGKDRLTDYGRAHIAGIQGNLWSETLGGEGRVEYMLVPRLFALAERGWAPDPDWARERDPAKSDSLYRAAWSRFVNVVGQRELPRLDREVPGLNYRIPTPGLKLEGGAVHTSMELPGFTLRYTTDGTEPTVRSAVVRGPIPLRGTVRVAAFNTTGRKGHTARLTAP